jgi:hypothetical protein
MKKTAIVPVRQTNMAQVVLSSAHNWHQQRSFKLLPSGALAPGQRPGRIIEPDGTRWTVNRCISRFFEPASSWTQERRALDRLAEGAFLAVSKPYLFRKPAPLDQVQWTKIPVDRAFTAQPCSVLFMPHSWRGYSVPLPEFPLELFSALQNVRQQGIPLDVFLYGGLSRDQKFNWAMFIQASDGRNARASLYLQNIPRPVASADRKRAA